MLFFRVYFQRPNSIMEICITDANVILYSDYWTTHKVLYLCLCISEKGKKDRGKRREKMKRKESLSPIFSQPFYQENSMTMKA